MKFLLKKQWFKGTAIAGLLALVTSVQALAADAPKPSELNNSLAIVLLTVIGALLLVIGLLAYVVIGAAQLYVERFKEKQKAVSGITKVVTLIALCLLTSGAFAADTPAADAVKEVVTTTIGGLSKSSFYGLIAVVAVELVVLFTLLFQLKAFLAKEKTIVL